MTTISNTTAESIQPADAERFLRLLAAAIFLVFFQSYMIAPLIPSLADSFHESRERIGLLIPAYMIPYAIGGLIGGASADKLGRRGLLFFSITSFPIVSLAMAVAPNANWLLGLRVLGGICFAGIAVMGLTLVGDLFPPNDRGRALGWVFGAIAGGGAFGSTLGGLLAPIIGWRGLFILTAVFSLALLILLLPMWKHLRIDDVKADASFGHVLAGYFELLRNGRAARTFTFIFLNAAFHGGVFTWIGVQLHDRYGLGAAGIGLALLGYGVPGFIFGPFIGKLVDRYGRRWFIPAGFLIAAISAVMFVPHWPLVVAILAATVLSLGFDMSHPLMAGISTMVSATSRGQAMGMNAFAIFLGFGVGSLLFGRMVAHHIELAFVSFAAVQAVLGVIAIGAFARE